MGKFAGLLNKMLKMKWRKLQRAKVLYKICVGQTWRREKNDDGEEEYRKKRERMDRLEGRWMKMRNRKSSDI